MKKLIAVGLLALCFNAFGKGGHSESSLTGNPCMWMVPDVMQLVNLSTAHKVTVVINDRFADGPYTKISFNSYYEEHYSVRIPHPVGATRDKYLALIYARAEQCRKGE